MTKRWRSSPVSCAASISTLSQHVESRCFMTEAELWLCVAKVPWFGHFSFFRFSFSVLANGLPVYLLQSPLWQNATQADDSARCPSDYAQHHEGKAISLVWHFPDFPECLENPLAWWNNFLNGSSCFWSASEIEAKFFARWWDCKYWLRRARGLHTFSEASCTLDLCCDLPQHFRRMLGLPFQDSRCKNVSNDSWCLNFEERTMKFNFSCSYL